MIIFPENPQVGQAYIAINNVKYSWDGTVWSSAGESPPTVAVSGEPPDNPRVGDVYFDNNDTMRAYVWIGSAWIDLSPGSSS
jgi:hypothetical protein